MKSGGTWKQSISLLDKFLVNISAKIIFGLDLIHAEDVSLQLVAFKDEFSVTRDVPQTMGAQTLLRKVAFLDVRGTVVSYMPDSVPNNFQSVSGLVAG